MGHIATGGTGWSSKDKSQSDDDESSSSSFHGGSGITEVKDVEKETHHGIIYIIYSKVCMCSHTVLLRLCTSRRRIRIRVPPLACGTIQKVIDSLINGLHNPWNGCESGTRGKPSCEDPIIIGCNNISCPKKGNNNTVSSGFDNGLNAGSWNGDTGQ